jgi:hypothetical protein
MRIELDDPALAASLVSFLRERECIAYVVDNPNTIEVIRAYSVGSQEADEIRSRLNSWRRQNPEGEFRVVED